MRIEIHNKKPETLDKMSCQYVKGIGARMAQLLAKCGIYTVQDILFHLPARYQNRTQLTPIRNVRAREWVVVEGEIKTAQIVPRAPGHKQLVCDLQDATGNIALRFFHLHPAQQALLQPGVRLRCFGEARFGQQGLLLIHPEYDVIDPDVPLPVEKYLTPIYPSSEGLSQKFWRKISGEALLLLLSNPDLLPDYLPHEIAPFGMRLSDALCTIHRPPADTDMVQLSAYQHPAQWRLAFEELLAHHAYLRKKRLEMSREAAVACEITQAFIKLKNQFLSQLNFKLTQAQVRAVEEIGADLARLVPMQRLLQGDVGAGKTVIAALASLQAICHGQQVALMAPTEMLAEQHYQHFTQWFKNLNIQVVWIAGNLSSKQRAENLQMLVEGRAQMAVGTHALFQEEVQFAQLGLIIIDEQHRFGVAQRLALHAKGKRKPHQLMMTATPIPRTLTMSLYADLDVSVLNELPPGRTPVKTVVVNAERRTEIIARICEVAKEKRQIYWVCPQIELAEEGENSRENFRAAEMAARHLKKTLPGLNIEVVHGRTKSAQKEKIMADFKAGNIDLLVATTVIEVGVNVPNASLMIIENAERLGLSQLHQLRGRVGRGTVESFCVLLYQAPLSDVACERLNVLRSSQDGFFIAEKDLALRGPGELWGVRQSGLPAFRIADMLRDQKRLPEVQKVADTFLQHISGSELELFFNRWIKN